MMQDPEMNELVEELAALDGPKMDSPDEFDEEIRNNEDDESIGLTDNQDARPLTIANVSIINDVVKPVSPTTARSVRRGNMVVLGAGGVTAATVTPVINSRTPNGEANLSRTELATATGANVERNSSNATISLTDEYFCIAPAPKPWVSTRLIFQFTR